MNTPTRKFRIVGTGTEAYNAGMENPETDGGTMLITVKCIDKGPRFGHYLIDMILLYIFIFIIAFILTLSLIKMGVDVDIKSKLYTYSIAGFCIVAYYTLFESMMQRTPGKYFTKSYVIDEYGNKPGFVTILKRSASRLVPFESLSCLSSDGRGWHDHWSNTYVVTQKELDEIQALLSIESIGNAEERRVGSEEE